MRSVRWGSCALLALFALVGTSAQAASVHETVDQPASLAMTSTASDCLNHQGPYIRLDGELRLGGINAKLILSNNRRFTHVADADVTVDVSLVTADDRLEFAKQPSRGGVGGNPHIWVQFNDCNGNELTARPTYLGRCVQGISTTSLAFDMATEMSMEVESEFCRNNPGPYITLEGEARLGGVCAELIFSNNKKFTHRRAETAFVDVILLEDGETMQFAKQPSEGGVGGNPHIWLEFLDGAGEAYDNPDYLGRCNRM